MRKILIVAALLAGGALLMSSPAAEAAPGCSCYKVGAPIGTPPVCTSGIEACQKMGGACLLPCDYQPPKPMAKHHGMKKKM